MIIGIRKDFSGRIWYNLQDSSRRVKSAMSESEETAVERIENSFEMTFKYTSL